MRHLLALLLLSSAAAAQERDLPPPSGLHLGPRAVFYVPADGEQGTWNPGAEAKYHFSRNWAAELSLDYQRHEFTDTTAHAGVAQLSALGYIGEGRLRGYVLAGLGLYATRVQGPDFRRNLGRFAPHAGGGLEARLNEDWSINAAYRHVWLSELETRNAATGALRRFQRSGEQISLAILRRFGGADQETEPEPAP